LQELKDYNFDNLSEPQDYAACLLKLCGCANLCSRHAVYQQYDHMVQIGTVVEPGSDAAVVRIAGTDLAIALSTDCNGRHCALDPYEGTKAAVAESARNVACSGAKPIAITNCLNFGNPYKPEAYYFFSEAIRGMSEACKVLGTPVTGGNVSFYNENPTGAIYPTPVIGMLGLMQDYRQAMTSHFKTAGDSIILLGSLVSGIGGSEFLKQEYNIVAGEPPKVDLQHELNLQGLLLKLCEEKLINSAHDVSDGGLLIAIAESCYSPQKLFGASLTFATPNNASWVYFGEAAGRVVISANSQQFTEIMVLSEKFGIELNMLGNVTAADRFVVNSDIDIEVNKLNHAWMHGLTL
ncbi:MAG: AIR synthase related protein, partial [Candidatus Cloacimonetes bacterium]|nr:AIR synthase related protein [Candidatus Cloacimonadota bacterium]